MKKSLKIAYSIFLLALMVSSYCGIYVLWMRNLWGGNPSNAYHFGFIGGLFILWFTFMYIKIAEERKKDREYCREIGKMKKALLEKFEKGGEIFIRVKRGFVTLPFVISKANNWKYIDNRFVCGNEHFTLKTIAEFELNK